MITKISFNCFKAPLKTKLLSHYVTFHSRGGDWDVVEVLLYVHRNHSLLGTGAQDGHLDFHTAPELWDWVMMWGFMSSDVELGLG